MVEIREVARSTLLVDCGEIPVYIMPQVIYLLETESGTILIEPGATCACRAFLEGAAGLGVDLTKIRYIIPTHIHVDHAGGAGYLARNLPQATVLLHPRGVRHMTEPARLIEATRAVFGQNCEEAFGEVLAVPAERAKAVEDGETVKLGSRELTVYYTPGHAVHHISILDSLTGNLFCGEALGFPIDGESDIVLPAGIPPFDADAYLESIDRLSPLKPKMLMFSHIGARKNPGNLLIDHVRSSSAAFSSIVGEGVQAGKNDQEIVESLSSYLQSACADPALLKTFKFDPSGYIHYYRTRQ